MQAPVPITGTDTAKVNQMRPDVWYGSELIQFIQRLVQPQLLTRLFCPTIFNGLRLVLLVLL